MIPTTVQQKWPKALRQLGLQLQLFIARGSSKKLRIFRMLMKNTHQMPGAPGGPEAASAANASGSQYSGFSTGAVENCAAAVENFRVSITRTSGGAYRLERENSAAVIIAASLAAVMAAAYGNTG